MHKNHCHRITAQLQLINIIIILVVDIVAQGRILPLRATAFSPVMHRRSAPNISFIYRRRDVISNW